MMFLPKRQPNDAPGSLEAFQPLASSLRYPSVRRVLPINYFRKGPDLNHAKSGALL